MQQENAPSSSVNNAPQQEHPTEPTEVTLGEETSGESEIQSGEQVTVAQLIQRIWLELLKDYDLTINYHPEKANIVADTLSRKSSDELATLITSQKPILLNLEKSGIEIRLHDPQVQLANLVLQPTLIERIKVAQKEDSELQEVLEAVESGIQTEFWTHEDGSLRFDNRLCVLKVSGLRDEILEEAHCSAYTMHPGSTKMYQDLKRNF
ncbi:uncharacterized protein [Elaeis guineensis]|uniref:uncharacterized protein n=1 Tax=Elaeis guineensis var. tenera TaxID=51953 RepID=UPI003C6D7E1B